MIVRIVGITLIVIFMSSCSLRLDGSTVVRRGDMPKSIYAVDGSIRIENGGHASRLHTVDGDINLGTNADAASVGSVDGDITLGTAAHCEGDVASVEGAIVLRPHSHVTGSVNSYAGSLYASGAIIDGQIRSVSSKITLEGHTVVKGGIVLDEPELNANVHDKSRSEDLPVVVIGAGVDIIGPIIAKRGGTLRVSKRAHINMVTGMDLERF